MVSDSLTQPTFKKPLLVVWKKKILPFTNDISMWSLRECIYVLQPKQYHKRVNAEATEENPIIFF